MTAKSRDQLRIDTDSTIKSGVSGGILPSSHNGLLQDYNDSLLNLINPDLQTITSPVEFTGDTQLDGVTTFGGQTTIGAIVYVNLPSDLPAAIAGVRTLAANTCYFLGAIIDIGSDRIVYSLGSQLLSCSTEVGGLISTTTSPILTASAVSLRATRITLVVPNGSLFQFSGTVTAAILLDNVVSASYQNVGIFTNVHSGLIDKSSFIGGINGPAFTGTGVGDFSIQRTRITNFSGLGCDLGTAVFNTISLETVVFDGLGGSTSFNFAAASANLTTRGTVRGCTFDGAGTDIAGGTVFDLKWTFFGNSDIEDSDPSAHMYAANNATVTVIAAATTPVKVNLGTSALFEVDNRFTVDTSGTITYNGLQRDTFSVTYSAYSDAASGTNNVYSFYVAKNGTPITGSKATKSIDNNNPGSPGPIQAIVELDTGDTIDDYVEIAVGTVDITVIDTSCVIR
ncbi:hypothetical protein KAR91_73025 [Candidatus Pacearchaeota archaeon]|nr:hypothetical protein [Candidatus Pacearchaeota archaeon]